MWALSIDFKDAYFHILIHRKYLGFLWKTQVWQYRTMPFGLAIAPRIFTMLVNAIVKWAQSHSIQIIAYLDDWLLVHQNPQVLLKHRDLVIAKLVSLGWVINTKSQTFLLSRSSTSWG